jgi:pyrimidine operon attenuation protein / uracil phosphoribosyltransferase
MAANIILHPGEIEHKIRRIAYQIYETFVEEEQVVIAGISKNGYVIAEKIAEAVREISPLRVTLCEVFINKQNPFEAVTTSIPAEEYRDKGLVLVDDVLHSGSTLIYGIKHFLDVPLKKFKTAVLVDRNHKKFPVKVDFKGISLSTSLQEHVEVLVENRELTALLH